MIVLKGGEVLVKLQTKKRFFGLILMVLGLILSPSHTVLAEPSVDSAESVADSVDHSVWNDLLAKYLKPHSDGVNRFDYRAVTQSDQDALQTYLNTLSAVDIAQFPQAAQAAYWINFYNALTVQVVLDHYPVQSIKQIRPGLFSFGPWKKKWVTVQGEALSLDDIEHVKLRAVLDDPRSHYAVNCASWGCPNLRAQAFTGAKLEGMLDDGARDYINHRRGVHVDDGGALILSSIFKWYADDFGGDDAAILSHIRQYADEALLEELAGLTSVASYAYDWTLNAPERAEGDY